MKAPARAVDGRSFSAGAAEKFQMTGASEFRAWIFLLALLFAFKMVNMFSYRFDNDEPQHLHVIWAWTRGLVQYRDVFDNHMPLFQLLCAPIFALFGDHVWTPLAMRFVLLPMYLVAAWCVFRIGTLIYSRRVGAWAVVLAGFYTGYFFISFEFRTDNLWAPLVLLCLTVLIDGPLSVRRFLCAGILFGLSFGVSMKSNFFLFLLALSGGIALWLVRRDMRIVSRRKISAAAIAFLGASALVPAIIMIFFAARGVWPQFYYCVFQHNFLPNLDVNNHPKWWIVIFPVTFPFVIYFAHRMVSSAPPALGFRRGFIFLMTALYLPALYSFWNLITRQDYLPFHPLAAIFVAAGILKISDWIGTQPSWPFSRLFRRLPMPVFIAAIEFLSIIVSRPFWVEGTKPETDLLRETLALTTPNDYVFDGKGETIFRRRCYYYVLEPLTMERFLRKLIPDTIAQRCIETHTCVACTERALPFKANRFIFANYLPVAEDLRVAGSFLRHAPNSPTATFQIAIPASYEIVARDVPVAGLLDGTPYNGARVLTAGRHTFQETSPGGTLVAIWAQAAERGYTPFAYLARSSAL